MFVCLVLYFNFVATDWFCRLELILLIIIILITIIIMPNVVDRLCMVVA